MTRKLYVKEKKRNYKRFFKLTGLSMLIIGFFGLLYIAFPLLSWQFYFAAFASEGVVSPLPHEEKESDFMSLLNASTTSLSGTDYTNAKNWYPSVEKDPLPARVAKYTISIPKIKITDAEVSTVDTDLSSHMVQYNSFATPPEKGNAVVFGHSTLPQLFNPKDYKTILAKAYTLKKGDNIVVKVKDVSYLYRIEAVKVVSAEDTSMFARKKDDSYLTLVTCTPPGTIWKRLVLEAKLQEL